MNKLGAILCLWTSAAFAQESADLVGRWRSVETSKGGIGAMYDFFQDGTVRFSPGAIVPMQYRLEGNRLTTYPVDGPSFQVSWTDDAHMRLAAGGGAEDYVRLGSTPDSANKLLGEWTGKRNMEGHVVAVHWIFRADSTALFMIRFTTTQGRYELRQGQLVATFGAQSGLNGPVTLANGTLAIERGPGRTTRLERY
jgi:hypothetical protein